MKSSEILSKAADLIESDTKDYKNSPILGGCYGILVAVGYEGKDAEAYRQKAIIAQSYFEKYRPEFAKLASPVGLHWWPMGNHPDRIAALRAAANDAKEQGD